MAGFTTYWDRERGRIKPTSTRNFPVNYREELNVLNVGSSFFRKNSVGRMLGIACLRSAKL